MYTNSISKTVIIKISGKINRCDFLIMLVCCFYLTSSLSGGGGIISLLTNYDVVGQAVDLKRMF